MDSSLTNTSMPVIRQLQTIGTSTHVTSFSVGAGVAATSVVWLFTVVDICEILKQNDGIPMKHFVNTLASFQNLNCF